MKGIIDPSLKEWEQAADVYFDLAEKIAHYWPAR